MTTAFDTATKYVTGLEEEVRKNPKTFYGNANLPADGHERVGSALRAVNSLKTRLEATKQDAAHYIATELVVRAA